MSKVLDYYAQIEAPCAQIFARMSNRGICVDLRYLESLRSALLAQKEPIEQKIKNELGPINLNSPQQVLKALNAKGIRPYLKGKPSIDKRALQYHKGPLVDALKSYSQIETLLSGFVYPYLSRAENVVHPFFNQCGTRTGRLSCSNPNLLQIPKHTDNGRLVRKMFVARPGMLLGDCDFGQIEPRVLAHFSNDPNLLRLFNNGTDFHSFTADGLGIDRQRAKILNLSVGYRASYKSVSQQLQCSDSEAQHEIDCWWNLFPSLRRWQDMLIYNARRSGFCETLMGRRIKVDALDHGNLWRREGAERQLINNITQGSAAEIMKLAMIKADCRLRGGFLVQVYDELLFESEQDQLEADMADVVGVMNSAVSLKVPLVVDSKTGFNWGDVA